ncbi:hypothetical protein VBH15_04745 [Vagococcus fluvialis]|uniref:hypothetical protein n=1 Tax=Vagococcus fluvialis TaxID=2738 RepID=UPI0037D12BC8
MKANEEIRMSIAINRFKNWEVAQKIGISDSRFSVWLRTPLNDEREKRVLNAIEELKREVS